MTEAELRILRLTRSHASTLQASLTLQHAAECARYATIEDRLGDPKHAKRLSTLTRLTHVVNLLDDIHERETE